MCHVLATHYAHTTLLFQGPRQNLICKVDVSRDLLFYFVILGIQQNLICKVYVSRDLSHTTLILLLYLRSPQKNFDSKLSSIYVSCDLSRTTLLLFFYSRGPDRTLTVSCQAVMPSVQGEQMQLGEKEDYVLVIYLIRCFSLMLDLGLLELI